jgi:tetratricopeptide (TPR) repeat protein
MRFIARFILILFALTTLFAEVPLSYQEQPVTLIQQGSEGVSESEALEILRKNPAHVRSIVTLGTVANRKGQLDVARGYLLRALELSPGNAEAHHQLALNHGYRREWDPAVEEMRVALGIEPNNSLYCYNLGALYYNSRSYGTALKQFRLAMQLQPNLFEPHFAMASCLEAEKKLQEAEAEFTRILEKYPKQARAYSARGALRMQLGDSEKARRDAEQAIRLKPAHSDAHYLLAKIHEQNQDLEKAVTAYQRVIELEKGRLPSGEYNYTKESSSSIGGVSLLLQSYYRLASVYSRLGLKGEASRQSEIFQSLKAKVDCIDAIIFGTNFLGQGDLPHAEERFIAAMRSDPQNSEAFYYMGLVHQQKGEPIRAVDMFQKALSLNANAAIVHANLGLTLGGLGRLEEARSHLERAVGLDNDDFSVTYRAGRGFLALENFSPAETALLRSLQLWPSQPTVLADLFELYVRWGKNDRAYHYAKLAAVANPLDHRLHYRLGLFYAGEQDFGQACQEFRKSVELKPDYVPPYLRLAWVYLELKQSDLALEAVSRYLQHEPKSGEAHYLKGSLRFDKGDAVGALEEVKIAADLSPRDPQVFFLLSKIYQHLGQTKAADEALQRYRVLASTTPG